MPREYPTYILIVIDIPLATKLSDGDLVSAVTRLVAEGRHRTADLIALLVALETRTVHVEAGYASLFRFCVGRLGLSEEEAFYRIAASRVAARFPIVLERLREGRLTLTAVALLRKRLTEANHRQVLEAAEGRSKREVQLIVARLAPQPDVAVSIRRVAQPRAISLSVGTATDPPAPSRPLLVGTTEPEVSCTPLTVLPDVARAAAPPVSSIPPELPPMADATRAPSIVPRRPESAPPAIITPLSPGRYSLRLTICEETHAKLRRAQDLLADNVRHGDVALVLDRALTLLLAQLERQKYAALRDGPKKRSPSAKESRGAARRPAPSVIDSPAVAHELPPTSSPIPAPPPSAVPPAAVPPATAVPTASATATTSAVSAARPVPERIRGRRRARYIQAAVRREVWRRDAGRCGYVAPDGNRCAETAGLEFHHTIPVAEGGEATASTVVLRCVRHHRLETRRWFGEEVTAYRGTGCDEPGGRDGATRAGPSKVVPRSRHGRAERV